MPTPGKTESTPHAGRRKPLPTPSSFVHAWTRRPSVSRDGPDREDGGIAFRKESTVVFSLIQLVIVAVPVVLAVLVVHSLRAASQMGGLPPFTSTYRAYSA